MASRTFNSPQGNPRLGGLLEPGSVPREGEHSQKHKCHDEAEQHLSLRTGREKPACGVSTLRGESLACWGCKIIVSEHWQVFKNSVAEGFENKFY